MWPWFEAANPCLSSKTYELAKYTLEFSIVLIILLRPVRVFSKVLTGVTSHGTWASAFTTLKHPVRIDHHLCQQTWSTLGQFVTNYVICFVFILELKGNGLAYVSDTIVIICPTCVTVMS